MTMEESINLSNVDCIDLSKSCHGINTGIGYFDHMLDQMNSHAQIGVAVTVLRNSNSNSNSNSGSNDSTILDDKNRYAKPAESQQYLIQKVGQKLGEEFKEKVLLSSSSILHSNNKNGEKSKSHFCCPLDEALVQCHIVYSPSQKEEGKLTYSLEPFGSFPKKGRSEIGCLQTKYIKNFFNSFAKSSGLDISLTAIRGKNGHHICESAFKAFSRALRNLLDGNDCDDNDKVTTSELWGIESLSYKMGQEMSRTGEIKRSTKETSISVELDLKPSAFETKIDTGILMLDKIFSEIANEAQISLKVKCTGDLHVDDHHTAEDVAIAVGKVLNTALGTKAGLNRMWMASDKNVTVVMDLSNRPCLTSNLSLEESEEEKIQDLSVEMVDHVFDSIVMNGQMTVHIWESSSTEEGSISSGVEELVLSAARAYGKALRLCIAVDPRRKGATASSKGTLSV